MSLHVRWLGRVPYGEALALQRALFERSARDHLLLLEHPPTYTLGVNADESNVLVDPATVGAELLRVDRGGDVTFHGPGQIVGYPIVSLVEPGSGALASTRGYVTQIETMLVEVLASFGVEATTIDRCPGVWVDDGCTPPRKIAAIGVRISRGRTMHGFALNVDPDLAMFTNIVPCGIADKGVTSMAAEGARVETRAVVDALVAAAARRWGGGQVERSDVVWRVADDDRDLAPFSRSATVALSPRRRARLDEAGVGEGVPVDAAKPSWMRARVRLDADVLKLRSTLRSLDLVTVCEEAGCPNLSECWSAGTATFMVCGERCTRACGFCLVDTRRPEPLDLDEPRRVAEAVAALDLRHAVVTMVARDDLPDGGAEHVAATIAAIRERTPSTTIEALISDLGGDADALATVLEARPDIVNHNIETVPRLQRVARPSARYSRSLALLARVAAAGAVAKSGLVVGLGETEDEIRGTLLDLASVGVSIVTIGQYLRPTDGHLPVARWWHPEDFARWAEFGMDALGLGHVESSPFTRSSYHAQQGAVAVSITR